MNRLKGLSCYLSGPLSYAEDKGKAWRDDMTEFMRPRNVHVFNPLHHMFWGTKEVDKIKRPRMDRLLKAGEFSKLRQEVKDLNHWDLRAVDLSSFLIVLIDPRIFTCGTFEEIFIANKAQKPVLIVNPLGKKKMPNWLFGRFPHEHYFNSFDSVKRYINNIDCNQKYKWTRADRKRWLFYDWEAPLRWSKKTGEKIEILDGQNGNKKVAEFYDDKTADLFLERVNSL